MYFYLISAVKTIYDLKPSWKQKELSNECNGGVITYSEVLFWMKAFS